MDAGPPTNDPSALEADDPRLVWYRRNADALVAREKAEKEAKENLLKKAQQFLEKAEEVGLHIQCSATAAACTFWRVGIIVVQFH